MQAECNRDNCMRLRLLPHCRWGGGGQRLFGRDQDGWKRLKADMIELDFAEAYRLAALPPALQQIIAGPGTISAGYGIRMGHLV